MSKLQTALLAGLLAASLAPLYGCGSECGPGTTDKDGQCIVDAKGCAAGTVLKDGECLLDTSGCADGTMLDGALCVPVDTVCEEGTTFDQGSYTCMPNTEILCGEGTEADANGTCVANADACAATTSLNDDGLCVVDAAACGQGTQLDPNSGDCVLADTACGQGTAFDSDSGACAPTAEVCDAGTAFDADSGLCLPDSCSVGDVVIDGVCVSLAEHLAGDPDTTEMENNDPAMGGAANSLLVPTVGDDPHVFVGTIDAASDIDGDGTIDQDVDVYQFEANAGEWFELAVLSTGMPEPAFKIEGPNGYERWSPLGGGEAARDIVIPEGGTYTVTVLPALVLQTGGDVDRIGGDDWGYVGTLKPIATPSATQVDLSAGAGQLASELPSLQDNFFEVTGTQSGDVVSVSVNSLGADAQAVVQVWSNSNTLESSQMLDSSTNIELNTDGASAFILVDWIATNGPSVDFDMAARISGTSTLSTLLPGDTATFTVSAQTYDQIVASQTNPSAADLDVTITEVTTLTELVSGTLSSDSQLNPLVTTAGDYEVSFTNNTSSNVDATLVAKAQPLPTLGPISSGNAGTYTHPSTVPSGQTVLVRLVVSEPGVMELSGPDAGGDLDLTLYDASMTEIDSWTYIYDEFSFVTSLDAGTYFIEADAVDALSSFEVSAEFLELPSANSSNPGLAIASNTTVEDTISISGCSTLANVGVYVLIPHTYIGDLIVTLESPAGTSVTLHDRSGGTTENIIGWYPSTLTVEGPGSLSDFVGEDANGNWKLTVSDNAGGDEGTLEFWALDLACQ